jgi:hypothetical protein
MTDLGMTEGLLRAMDARYRIKDALMRNARGVDRLDRGMILSAYHPGARDNHGSFDGCAEDFADWVLARHTGKIHGCTHFLGNSLVRLDGDTARCETYNSVYYRMPAPDGFRDMVAFGRYADRFECRDGDWRIADRLVVFETDRVDRLARRWELPMRLALAQGTRDMSDPSYDLPPPTISAGENDVRENEIRARLQIHDALMRLCRGADRRDRALIVSAFHPDAHAVYGSFSGSREELAGWLAGGEDGGVQSSVHFLGNELTWFTGETAWCESYYMLKERSVVHGQPCDLTIIGRYLDRFEERDGEWRIVSRRVVIDQDRVDPVGDQWDDPMKAALIKGVRSRADASYQVLETT